MKVRYGIIGAGNIARKFTEAVQNSTNAQVEMVASRTIEKSQKFADTYNIPYAIDSYQELLDSDKIDAVYIAVVNHAHAEWIEKAILSGKAVLCEKPMILDFDDAKRLISLAKEKDVLLMEAMWTRFLPTILKAKEWLSEGKIGKMTSMDVDFTYKLMQWNPNGRLLSSELRGGGMHDVGVYCLEFAMDMAQSKVKTTKALANICETGVDSDGLVLLRFESGEIARITFGINSRHQNDAVLYGMDGHIFIESFFEGSKAILCDKAGNEVDSLVNDVENGFIFEVEHFSDLVITGAKESTRMPLSDSLECSRLFDEIRAQWED